ncbi:hypothetical protein EUU23_12405 [Sphingorhabdus sp. IMCC26285]|uniref:Uncharacterized protein n=1 Tax=Sphingorhabdus profundilacus TaxID=2509718 RepID=A0A6I4M2W4_9SPHN|nr:hypothetical protein [Sphingorhabdus profundilacus]MVZ98496.1 hypothetical protein [Sphingorhabdus profundilacus]
MNGESKQPLLIDWRQGDIILTPFHLPVVVARENGHTKAEFLLAEYGVAIVSQTCDIVKSIANCPYVQVAPLVPVDPDEVEQILRNKKPRLIIVPGLMEKGLAIDLDSCATVKKEVIAGNERLCGCTNDASQLMLSRALGRHRGRFAFPDEFNESVARPVAEWISEKYKKQSAQGELAKSIVEVRVSTDNWDAPSFLTFYILCDGPLPKEWPKEWSDAIDRVTKKASISGAYPDPEFVVTTFADISAAEYRASVQLDWDGLSPTND